MTPEEKKELQKNRMKTYFVESAKELIIEEGIENLTTKKIGDRAGYSYATIYNYFSNFNELICVCIEEFSEEMKNELEEKTKCIDNTIDKLVDVAKISIDYALHNINIYNLFLTNSIDFNYFKTVKNTRFVHPGYNLILDIIKEIPDFSHLNPEEVHAFADLILSLFHAKVQFFISLKFPDTQVQLEEDILTNLNFLINVVKK